MARYRFGVFEADGESGELTRAGRRIHLAPQPMRALLLFLERPGTIVTRDELRQALWGEGTFVEFDQGLTFAVGRIRLALGDDARSARFLETVPRRGYRFVAPVERHDPPRGRAPAPVAPPVSLPARGRRRLAVAALCALLAGSSPAARPRHEPPPDARAAFERGQQLAGGGRKRESLPSFREAARLDPAFAEAHFAIASVYAELAEAGELASGQAFPIARLEAERALALEDVADSHLVRAAALFQYQWDRSAARRAYARAVELAPSDVAPWTAYARLLSAEGDHAAALAAIGRAEALSPTCDLVLYEAGWAYYRARRFPEAIRKFERAADLGPPHFTDAVSWRRESRFRILIVHLRAGETAAAREDAVEIARLSGTAPQRLAALAALPPGEAPRRVLSRSLEFLAARAEHEYVTPVRFAEVQAALGDEDRALESLARAADERAPALAYSVADPIFDRLRARPEFRRIADAVSGVRGDERPGLVADAGTGLPSGAVRR